MGTEQQWRTPPMVAMPVMLLMILAMMAAPCQAKAFTQRSFLDFISGAEAFQGDDGSAEGALIPAKPPVKPPAEPPATPPMKPPAKPPVKPPMKYPVRPAVVPTLLPPIYEPDGGPSDFPCPFGCMCQAKVMHCSGVGLKKVPANLPPGLLILDLQNNKISELRDGDFDGLKVLQVSSSSSD
uniref:Decorin n=1 Tax=Petromyzon marinus TaxID=7757 RepID=A0AAJ7WJG0_PETMA